jgi:RNA-directed DNA polymerase
LLSLYQLSGTEIKRHRKVKGAFNPFDPEWEQYGEQLRQARMEHSMRYRKQWVSLYMSQDGLCSHCGCALTKETGWHDHHLEYRMHGGTDALSNRVLLHPHCHQQVHAGKIAVTKPARS